MKVLHVAAGNLFGGVEQMLMTLACERSCTEGMESHFAVCFQGHLSRRLLAVPAPVKMLGPLIMFIFPCTFIVLGFPIVMKFMASGL